MQFRDGVVPGHATLSSQFRKELISVIKLYTRSVVRTYLKRGKALFSLWNLRNKHGMIETSSVKNKMQIEIFLQSGGTRKLKQVIEKQRGATSLLRGQTHSVSPVASLPSPTHPTRQHFLSIQAATG